MELIGELIGAVEKVYDSQFETARALAKVQYEIEQFEEKMETPFVDEFVHKDISLGVDFEEMKTMIFKTSVKDNTSIIENLDFKIISAWEIEEEVTNKRDQVIGVNSYNVTGALYSKFDCWNIYSDIWHNFKGDQSKLVKKYNKDTCVALRVKQIPYAQAEKQLNCKKQFRSLDDICYSKWNVSGSTRYYKWNDQEPLKVEVVVTKDSIEVVGPKDANKTPVLYLCKVNAGGKSYEISRRYKQFEKLYNELKKGKYGSELPPFPPKLAMGNQKHENLWYRATLFKKLFKFISCKEDLLTDPCVVDFVKE